MSNDHDLANALDNPVDLGDRLDAIRNLRVVGSTMTAPSFVDDQKEPEPHGVIARMAAICQRAIEINIRISDLRDRINGVRVPKAGENDKPSESLIGIVDTTERNLNKASQLLEDVMRLL